MENDKVGRFVDTVYTLCLQKIPYIFDCNLKNNY